MRRAPRVGQEILISDNDLDTPKDRAVAEETMARVRAIGRFRAQVPERLRALYQNQGLENEEGEPLPELPEELMNVEVVAEEEPEAEEPEAVGNADGDAPNDAALGPGEGQVQEELEDQEEIGIGQGDAQYHTYTGRGPVAKHKSEMYEERGDYQEQEEQAFQRTIISKLQQEYQTQIGEKDGRIQQINGSIAESGEEGSAVMEIYDRISASGKALEEKQEEEIHNLERAAYLKWELKALSREYKQSGKQMKKFFLKSSSIREKDKKILKKRTEARETLREILYRRRTLENVYFADTRIQRQKNVIQNSTAKMTKNGEKWEKAKAQIDGQVQELQNIASRHENTNRQQRELTQRAVTLKEEVLRQKEESELLLDAEKDRIGTDRMTENLRLFAEKKKLEQEKTDLEKRSDKAQEQVLAADLLLVPSKDGTKSGRGIYVNGKLYLEEPEDELFESVEYDEDETKLLTEEQQIVTALKQREILQYVNSDNLMEYLTYDENYGDFQIPEQVNPELPKEELRTKIQEIKDKLEEMGVQTQIGQLMEQILDGDEIDLERISSEILQEALRIEATGANFAEDNPEKMGPLSPLKASSAMLFWGGIGSGFVNVSKFLGLKILNAGFEYAGIERLKQGRRSKKTGDCSMTGYQGYLIYSGMLELLKGLSLGMNMLFKLSHSGIIPTFLHESVWGNLKVLSFELLGESSMSALGAVSSGLNIGSGLIEGIMAGVDKGEKRKYAAKKQSMGQKLYGRVLEDAAVEKEIQQINGLVKAAMGGVSMAFALTGLGGLVATGITFVTGFLTKLIAGAVRRASRKKEVLNSPEILGGINYDDKLISEDDFNLLLANVTGLNDKDSLYTAIKVTDSINVHRAMRRSILHPDPDVDTAMEGLGYRDKAKYKNIKLKDIQKKIGYNGDWKKDLRHGIEIKGIDYDTNFTRVVKGIRGTDFYEKKLGKRLTRQEIMAKRREAIMARGNAVT